MSNGNRHEDPAYRESRRHAGPVRIRFLLLALSSVFALPAAAADYPIYDCAEGGYEEVAAPAPETIPAPGPSS